MINNACSVCSLRLISKLEQKDRSCIEKTLLAKYKATFTLKKRNNKEEIEGVHEKKLQQNSRLNLLPIIFSPNGSPLIIMKNVFYFI